MHQTGIFQNSRPLSFLSMFTRPLAIFSSLREQPQWLYPALLTAVVAVATNLYVIQRIGLVRLIEAASEAKAIIDPQGAIQSILEHQDRILCFQSAFIFVNAFVLVLVTAKVLWLLMTLFGHDISFKKILAVVTHANMPPAIIRSCMTALTAAVIPDVRALDLKNPLATNVAFFLQPTSSVAFRILSSLDAITLLNIGLLIIGLTRVCSNLSARSASLMVLIPWTTYVGATLMVPL